MITGMDMEQPEDDRPEISVTVTQLIEWVEVKLKKAVLANDSFSAQVRSTQILMLGTYLAEYLETVKND